MKNCPRPICACAATIGAAICAEQSSANSQADYTCHNVMRIKAPLVGIAQRLSGLLGGRRGRGL